MKNKDFYGRDFAVSPDVLIPRPETEQIIDEVLLLAGKPYLAGMKAPSASLPDNPLILDIGTGSGCIAITLKLELKNAEVIGMDISDKALRIARNNAEKLNASVDFIYSDLLRSYTGKAPDLIVANLPYVDENWDWLDKDTLSNEPSVALYSEDGGLRHIKRLLEELDSRAWKTKIILEADPCQHEKIIDYANKLGFTHDKTNGFVLVLH